jgi:hypothetical protein
MLRDGLNMSKITSCSMTIPSIQMNTVLTTAVFRFLPFQCTENRVRWFASMEQSNFGPFHDWRSIRIVRGRFV